MCPLSVNVRSSIALGALALLAAGCSETPIDELGEDLGTFSVMATQSSSSCGAGALGAPAIWEFDIRFVRHEGSIYWVNGPEYVGGRLASDGVSFAIQSTKLIDLSDEYQYQPCVIARTDSLVATLDDADAVEAFTGTLRYGYTPRKGDDCSAYVGVDGGFSALPCQIGFTLEGDLTIPPEPQDSAVPVE